MQSKETEPLKLETMIDLVLKEKKHPSPCLEGGRGTASKKSFEVLKGNSKPEIALPASYVTLFLGIKFDTKARKCVNGRRNTSLTLLKVPALFISGSKVNICLIVPWFPLYKQPHGPELNMG